MKVALTNLSNSKFEKSRLNLNESAKRYGVDEVYSFDFDKDIRGTEFYTQNEEILSQKRGVGYWLWKPYIILKTIESLQDGDILIYCDCGIEIIRSLAPLIAICKEKEPIFLFGNRNYLNANFTKRDCFIMMDCDHERYWYSMQCDGAFMLFRKNNDTVLFLREWMEYCKNKHLITDVPNMLGKENLPGFFEHRHDQSVFSLLVEKYNINLYRMPTHYNNNIFLPVKMSDANVPRFKGGSDVAEKTTENSQATAGLTYPFNAGQTAAEDIGLKKRDQFKYNYLIAYYNSSYSKILYHHRNGNIGIKEKIKFKLRMMLVKAFMKFGYKLEKLDPVDY